MDAHDKRIMELLEQYLAYHKDNISSKHEEFICRHIDFYAGNQLARIFGDRYMPTKEFMPEYWNSEARGLTILGLNHHIVWFWGDSIYEENKMRIEYTRKLIEYIKTKK